MPKNKEDDKKQLPTGYVDEGVEPESEPPEGEYVDGVEIPAPTSAARAGHEEGFSGSGSTVSRVAIGLRIPKLRASSSGSESEPGTPQTPRERLQSPREAISDELTRLGERQHTVLHSPKSIRFRLLSRSNSTLSTLSEDAIEDSPESVAKLGLAMDKRLGRGNSGTVSLAQKIPVGEETASPLVAVKKIKKGTIAELKQEAEKEGQFHQFCLDEKIAGMVLIEDNVIDLSANGTYTLYQMMAFMPGGDGEELIKDLQRVDIEKRLLIVKHVAVQLLRIFAGMDSKRVYHRDFKPDNFLLDLEGNCKICDFGSAVVFDEQGTLKIDVGGAVQSMYFAPENWLLGKQRKHYVTAGSVDAWRLGLTLAQLVGGPVASYITEHVLLTKQQRIDRGEISLDEIRHTLLAKLEESTPNDKNLRDVIAGLLMFDPAKRLKVQQALNLISRPDVDMAKQYWHEIYQMKHANRAEKYKEALFIRFDQQMQICVAKLNRLRQEDEKNYTVDTALTVGRLLSYISELDRTKLNLQVANPHSLKDIAEHTRALRALADPVNSVELAKLFRALPKEPVVESTAKAQEGNSSPRP